MNQDQQIAELTRKVTALEERLSHLEPIVQALASMTVADECGGGSVKASGRNAILIINDLRQ